MPTDKLVTSKAAAELMGVKPGTLRCWKCAKNPIWAELGPVQIGGRVNYSEAAVLAFIAKNRLTGRDMK